MKFLSHLSAALMLGVATVSLVAAPSAEAQKKKKEKAPKLKPSKEFGQAYNNSIQNVESGDAGAIQSDAASLRILANNDDDKHLLGNYLLAAGKKLQDAKMSIEGIDLLIASPKTTDSNRPIFHYQKGAEAFNGLKDYDLAVQSFEQAYALGLRRGNIEANTSNAYALKNDYPNAVKWLKTSIEADQAAGKEVPERNYRLLASHANKVNNPQFLTDTMQYIITKNPSQDYWHDAIVLHMRGRNLGSQETLDLMRLMRETKTLRFPQQYAEYVEVADPRRFPIEVVRVLDEGFAAGTISKSDVSFSDSYNTSKGRSASYNKTWDADEREANASSKGFIALITGDDMLAAGDYARAAKLYDVALSKGNIVDTSGKNQTDRAALRLGIARIKLGQYDAAKAAMARITGAERKEIGEFWALYGESKVRAAAAAAPAAAAPVN